MGRDRDRMTVEIEEAVLAENFRLAAQNRDTFHQAGVEAINIVSSPGSGKTTLLEKTLSALQGRVRVGIIVGDLQTDNDAQRLRGKGAPVVQVVTGGYCHLDSTMVAQAAEALGLQDIELLIIENVGNLVCPAAYDLGENRRVVMISVTEGEDKPLKYPVIFHNADCVVVTKTDLIGPCETDMNTLRANIRQAAPLARVIELSARTGDGVQAWINYLSPSA